MIARGYPSSRPTVPITESSLNPRTLEENRRAIEDRLSIPATDTRLDLLAKLLGGLVASVDLAPSTSSDESADVVVDHALGRIPGSVIIAVATDGLGGQVLGAPPGQAGTAGANQGAWSTTQVRLRSDRAATFLVVIA